MNVNRIEQIIDERNTGHWNLTRFRSNVYDACLAAQETAFTEGQLPAQTKALIAVGIAIQMGNEARIESQIVRAAALGTEFRQMLEAIEVGIAMGGVTGLESARAAFFILDRIYPQEILKI